MSNYFIEYDENIKIRSFGDKCPELLGLDKNDLIGNSFTDDILADQNSAEIREELKVFKAQDAKVLKGESLSILDGHFYRNGFEAFFTKKWPLFSKFSNKIIGLRTDAFPIKLIFEPEIKTIIESGIYQITDKIKSNFKEYFYSSKQKKYMNCYQLSQREIDCLYYIAHGFSYPMIAKKMYVSPRTIESYMNNIKSKLGCVNRDDIVEKIFSEKLF